jgi:hypothetical protein
MRACYLLATVPARVWQGPHAGMHPSQKNETKHACVLSPGDASFYLPLVLFRFFGRGEFTRARYSCIRLSLPERSLVPGAPVPSKFYAIWGADQPDR